MSLAVRAVPLAVALIAAASACAQSARKSQLGTVSQMIGTTKVEIVYRRPVARGRELFGALVPWGRVWSPSADTAAMITLDAPVLVNGEGLPPGTYSVFTIPDPKEWTIIFSRAHPVFHLAYPNGQDALRVKAVPIKGAHMETLAFYFPVVDGDSAVMNLHWGETVVPIRLGTRY